MVRVAPVWPKAGGATEEETRAIWVSAILPDMAREMAVELLLESGEVLLPVSRGPAGVVKTSLLAAAARRYALNTKMHHGGAFLCLACGGRKGDVPEHEKCDLM